MDAWEIILIIFGIAIFIIIIASIGRRKKKKQPEKKISSRISYGDFVSAGRLYIDQKRHREAADLYFQMPPEKRPAYEAMITRKLGAQGAQLFWIKTGRRLERSQPEKARIVFMLAGAYFDAIKMYIEKNDSQSAIDIVRSIPENYRENTVRRLSQYAFNRGKYHISADLLRSVGLVEEADAILAVGAHDFGTISRRQEAAEMYDTVGRQDLVGESQEKEAEKALAEGRFDAAKVAFKKAVDAYDESSQPKDALRVEERMESIDLLDKFQGYAEQGNAARAEDMIDEIIAKFPNIAVADLYSRIAVALEKGGKHSEAIAFYDKAADSTQNPVKRQGYVNALRRLSSQIASHKPGEMLTAESDMRDNCIVCRRPIKRGASYLLCPYCNKPAHYSHLLEWVKVQGSCPNCHKKLRFDDFKRD